MSIRHIAVAVSAAVLLASSTYGVLAAGAAGSQSGTSVTSQANQGGSTTTVSAGGSQDASATSGGGAGAGTSGGGSGFAGTLAISGNGGTGGYAFAIGGTAPHIPTPGSPTEETPVAGGSGASELCVLTVKNWGMWRALKVDVRRAASLCTCPTNPKAKLPQICPRAASEIFAAEIR